MAGQNERTNAKAIEMPALSFASMLFPSSAKNVFIENDFVLSSYICRLRKVSYFVSLFV